MENRQILLVAAFLACLCLPCRAQRWSLSTNVLDYANFGTMNLEGSLATGQHWSMTAVAKLNPFHYRKGDQPFNARQQVYGVGVKFWPWHVYSGWWAGTRLQYQEYNRGGIRAPETDEGDRYGIGLSGGYSYMLNRHLNLDVGIGVWGGYDRYVTYSCPVCGITLDSGERTFILPSDLILSLVYVF
ncbi:MAG: DUF3575 domain-containing protein [Bacteroidales bacterium]|nr:DUF3575 domain-containing protein [Bacteroidales bacterium]